MSNQILGKKKVGDVLCDIGKYMLTVIPFTYFMADKPGALYVLIVTAIVGVFMIIFGIYFISHSASQEIKGNSQRKKIKLLKNSVFIVEEEK